MSDELPLPNPQLNFSREKLEQFCRKWKITELSFFGSVLREDFRPDSDVDVLVTFDPKSRWGLVDWENMESEARAIFGRKVDMVPRDSIERSRNPRRRREILNTARRIYAA